MKCIKSINSGDISKVSNQEADNKVNIKQSHVYTTKKEWKQKVRDINKEKTNDIV